MRCEYTSNYLRGEFKCQREQIPDSTYCIFHDNEYWKNDSTSYDQMFNQFFQTEVIEQGFSLLIGYHIPSLVYMGRHQANPMYFDHAKFHGPIHFSETIFHNEVSFISVVFENEAYFLNTVFLEKPHFRQSEFKDKAYFRSADFRHGVNFYATIFENESTFQNTVFQVEAFFPVAEFKEKVNFVGARFNGKSNFSNTVFSIADFSQTDFVGEVEFFFSKFPKFDREYDDSKYAIPIQFDYATFRERARFSGKPDSPLDLGAVSFKGVDLSNTEFHNVQWISTGFPTHRKMIVDEKILDLNENYEEVSKIYNQLRKNYESKLLFNEASNFFIGELESIRKSLSRGTITEKFMSIPYGLYKIFGLYGESAVMPLLVWTPAIILGLAEVREIFGICAIKDSCDLWNRLVDSFSAYFLMPRSNTNPLDLTERIISVPILSMAYIALRRKFERKK